MHAPFISQSNRRHALAVLCVLIVGLAAYANTWSAPFQMDEGLYLRDNPFVREGGGSVDVVRTDPELYKSVVQRYVAYLTFALNYRIHGLHVIGYHVVNVAIHLLNALLVYVFVLVTFRTPMLRSSVLTSASWYPAFFTALFFVAHPVQTEAVTYIMQRLTSLAAFFSLVSIVLYGAGRLAEEEPIVRTGRSRWSGPRWWYAGAVLFAVLAMKTKENAFILPMLIALYEAFFFTGEVKKRVVRLLPILATMLIIPLTTYLLLREQGVHLAGMAAGGGGNEIPWWSYLITQSRVLVTYVRLLVVPFGQNFYYDYPVYQSLLEPAVLLSLTLHACIVSLGIILFRSATRVDPALRVVSFGILWFYVALSVESSIIPLPRVICEYRMYLPSVGFILAVISGVFILFAKTGLGKGLRAGLVALSVLLVGTAYAAYNRNDVWRDTVSLWEDTAGKSPENSEVHTNLGAAFVRWGRYPEAMGELQTALQLASRSKRQITFLHIIHTHLGTAYSELGRSEDAIREFQIALKLSPQDVYAAKNLALEYARLGRFEEAGKLSPEFLTK